MKPSWKDAPQWAQWLAMDEDTTWYWYELEPEKVLRGWNRPMIDGERQGRLREAECALNPWEESKESRR